MILLLGVFPLHAQHVRVRTPSGTVEITVEGTPSDRVPTRWIVREIRRRLDRLEALLEEPTPRSRRRVRRLIREIRGLLTLLPENVRVPIVIVPGEDEFPGAHEGMAPEAFHKLLAQLEDASFADDQLEILQTAAAHNTFTAHQARRILEKFSFEEDRLNAAKILAPRIVDRENLHELYDAFEFSSSKKKLKEVLEGE
jgi:hypothetical protein